MNFSELICKAYGWILVIAIIGIALFVKDLPLELGGYFIIFSGSYFILQGIKKILLRISKERQINHSINGNVDGDNSLLDFSIKVLQTSSIIFLYIGLAFLVLWMVPPMIRGMFEWWVWFLGGM